MTEEDKKFDEYANIAYYALVEQAGTVEGVRLRLDWSLSKEALTDSKIDPETIDEHVNHMMFTQGSIDVADLIINGDTDSEDPLLRTMDGEKKLGKTMKSVKSSKPEILKEYNEKSGWLQYQMFFALTVEFE